jgi:sugar/nucleoside kinase (ribokinase family)
VPLLVVAGTLLVDDVLTLAHAAAPGTQQRALAHRLDGGGQVWHTARAAAGTGAPVAVVGRCGGDLAADRLVAVLKAEGIEVLLHASGRSRRAVVLDAPPHDRAIVSIAPDPDARPLPPGTIALPHDTSWLHLDGYGLDDSAGDALLELAESAAARGVRLSLEPPSVTGLPWRRERLAALPALDLLVGRPDEVAETLTLLPDEPREVVTHDGPRPVTYAADGRTATVPVPDEPFERTLGAGDRFTGGLLAGLLRGERVEDSLHHGIAAARG